MGTELRAAEVKVRIETEDAIRQVDAIEKEQMRRSGSRRPGPGDGVERPHGGFSLINGAPESVPITTAGDARNAPAVTMPAFTSTPGSATAEAAIARAPSLAPQVAASAGAAAAEAQATATRAAGVAGRAAGFVSSPAQVLGAEISAGAFASAGPIGAALVSSAMLAGIASSSGPTIVGAAEGFAAGLLSRSPNALGIVTGILEGIGISRFAEAYRTMTVVSDAFQTAAKGTADAAFSMARLGGGIDTEYLTNAAPVLFQTQLETSAFKSKTDIAREKMGAAVSAYAVEQMFERMIIGGGH